MTNNTPDIPVCPVCHGPLSEEGAAKACGHCGLDFTINANGFFEFALDSRCFETVSTTDKHVELQSSPGARRLDEEYIIPYLLKEQGIYLDAGCGIGRTVTSLLERGYDAYGIDLPNLAPYWEQLGNDPGHFFSCDAARLPFPDNYFDAVISLGVIEHIGTLNGEATLGHDYREARRGFAAELLRVTRPGGRIMVSCPNKHFPVDPQHQVVDEFSRDDRATRIRNAIWKRTGLNLHKTWGRYHLLSYAEVGELFCREGGAAEFTTLPIEGYFELRIFRSGILRLLWPLADLYINRMPELIRKSWLNPYMLVEVRK